VELFLPGPEFITAGEILDLAESYKIKIAAIGTGAGLLRQGLTLTDSSPEKRQAALEFILVMVKLGGQIGAPAILGSMQGKWGGEVSKEQALVWLADALQTIGEAAAAYGVPFIYEPLNRYETNLINRLSDGVDFLSSRKITNVTLLADLFHMNIEETHLGDALRYAHSYLGHVHWADSNRQAMGLGHTEVLPIVDALREIGYRGYLSAEIFPLPDPESAALQTLHSMHSSFP
jgi:sugar phosphate isomerase/epimerase